MSHFPNKPKYIRKRASAALSVLLILLLLIAIPTTIYISLARPAAHEATPQETTAVPLPIDDSEPLSDPDSLTEPASLSELQVPTAAEEFSEPEAPVTPQPVTTQPPTAKQPSITTAPPVVTQPPVTTTPPVTTQPPATTAPPMTTQPPVVTQPPVTTTPPVTTAPPMTTQPPVTTAPPVTATPPVQSAPPVSTVRQIEEIVRLVNEIRVGYGLKVLTLNEKLSQVAQVKAQDMASNRYFAHQSPTYGSPFDMMKSFGVSYRTAGENLAMGYSTPAATVNGWMNSEGHRANILNGSFTKIGMGYVAAGNYYCQMFIG